MPGQRSSYARSPRTKTKLWRSTTNVDLNGHAALLVEFKQTTATPVTFSKAYYLRFQPDKLTIFAAFPNELLDSSDLQGIIQSIAFNDSETVSLPVYAPLVVADQGARVLQPVRGCNRAI